MLLTFYQLDSAQKDLFARISHFNVPYYRTPHNSAPHDRAAEQMTNLWSIETCYKFKVNASMYINLLI